MKLIVIGAGLIGLASAHFLRALGHDVIVLERRSGPALETSYANAGMLTPSQAEPWNMPGILWKVLGWLGREDAPVLLRPSVLPSMLSWGVAFLRNSARERFVANTLANARLARLSLAELRALRRSETLDYGQICAGTLKIYRDAKEFDDGLEIARTTAAAGVTQRILDRDAAVALEPALADVAGQLAGAIHFPDDESGNAYRFCTALATSLQRRGVEIRCDVDVHGFVPGGRRVAAVRTAAGEFGADAFVLCAGSHAPRLAAGLAVRLPIRPVKGYSITIPMAAGRAQPRMSVADEVRHAAMTPMDGQLRIAGTAEFAGFDLHLTPARIRNLLDVVGEVLPAHKPPAGADLQPWCGLRPYSCDGVPIIGQTRVENLYVNAGHGHLGWTLAAGSGKLLAQLLTGRAPDVDPIPYRPERF
jgi:D-amino-acid dehydrogenase